MIKAILFDWGNTLMTDFPDETGPMFSWSRIEAVKNAEANLAVLSQKFPCYIATNAKDSSKEDIYKALNAVDLGKYISDIFCFKEIGYEKPSAEFFNSILSKLSLTAQELVLVGDDIEKDFNGAIRNGIVGILFDPENKHVGIEPRINDLSELPELIGHFLD